MGIASRRDKADPAQIAQIERDMERLAKEQSDKQGHLLQRNTTGLAGWQKSWFVLKDGYLYCYKNKKDVSSAGQPLNIMLCTTRIPPIIPGKMDGGCQFEIVTPDKKKPFLLQAETERERAEWLEAIQEAI